MSNVQGESVVIRVNQMITAKHTRVVPPWVFKQVCLIVQRHVLNWCNVFDVSIWNTHTHARTPARTHKHALTHTAHTHTHTKNTDTTNAICNWHLKYNGGHLSQSGLLWTDRWKGYQGREEFVFCVCTCACTVILSDESSTLYMDLKIRKHVAQTEL